MSRSKVTGPLAGAYVMYPLVSSSVAAAQASPGLRVASFICPANMRLMEANTYCRNSAGGASRGIVRLRVGTTDLITASALVVDTDTNIPAANLVQAQRTRTKGDQIDLRVETPAAEVVTELTVLLTFQMLDHVVSTGELPDTND